jgi:hypothetical protein
VLGVAHAYEQATQWWKERRAAPESFSPPAPIAYVKPQRATSGVDPQIVGICERAAASAGLSLSEEHLAILCGATPALLEMIRNVRGAAGSAEPANVFALS